MKNAEKGMEDAGKKTGRFGDIVKGVLTADAIKAGARALVNFGKQIVNSYAEYEQLVGGVQKIFDEVDYSKIEKDANEAFVNMGLSASQYYEKIVSVGAGFTATMGDEKGYEVAKRGMQAISDYSTGTGRNIDELNDKFSLITRSTASYQSIADQFSGLLPATSAAFLEQAQSAGLLSDSYTSLTQVPMAEYQEAIVGMLEKGNEALGLTGNTAKEATTTLSGSIGMMKSAFSNFVTGLADENADIEQLTEDLVSSVGTVVKNLAPVVWQVLQTIGKMIWDGIQTAGNKANEAIGRKLDEIKAKIRNKLAEIKNNIISPFIEARDRIRGFVEDIKSFFANLKVSLPKIKMPHFKVSYTEGGALWKALGFEGKPKLSVDWYAKAMNNAMLLNSPTIFGMSGGKFLGGGEAGQEVVAGSDTLMGMIRGAVAEQLNNSAVVGLLSEIAQNTGAATTIDINRREFGRLVKEVV